MQRVLGARCVFELASRDQRGGLDSPSGGDSYAQATEMFRCFRVPRGMVISDAGGDILVRFEFDGVLRRYGLYRYCLPSFLWVGTLSAGSELCLIWIAVKLIGLEQTGLQIEL